MAITELSLNTTQHLVQQSRAGDESAFAALVEAHQSAVFGTVLRLVYDREVAAEVSNRAFFKAYRAPRELPRVAPAARYAQRGAGR